MTDGTIIQRMYLGPVPPRNNWTDASLVKLTKPSTIGVVVEHRSRSGPSQYNITNTDTEASDTSDEEDELMAIDKAGSTLVKLNPDSPYFFKAKCVDETTLDIRLVEMLRTTMPPKLWEYDGKVYFQEALARPITRKEVLQFRDKFNRSLLQRRSSKYGLCAIRREIFREGLDEIIRQALMVAPERGLCLIRIKNEFELTILAYNTAASQAFYYKHKPDPLKKTDLGGLQTKHEELDSEISQQKQRILDLQQQVNKLEMTVTDSRESCQLIQSQRKLQFERNITQLKLHKKALETWEVENLSSQNQVPED